MSPNQRATSDATWSRLRSPAHGFCDDEATRRLLRGRPPRQALDWVGQVLDGRVLSVRPLRGGMSSAVHLIRVERQVGGVEPVVLRRYVRPELNVEEPDIAHREGRILRFVEGVAVPTPRLLAVDPSGAQAGVPTVLMSRVPGRLVWSPSDMERWLVRLAELLPLIHGATPPAKDPLGSFAPYRQDRYDPPPWARWPKVWERAVEIFHAPPPDLSPVFIQRDFHPGNVLWRRGWVSGVVDWQAACVGPASADVAHCRANLLRYGPEVADRFTATWERLTGEQHHPWADVVTIVGFLDGLHDEPGSDRFVVEDALARAVSELDSGP